ncbi:DsbA family oxidoreductase [Solwaraspora sp. WMMD792]|uniref:DsbA family oxidoreductase n=1 Tax=Solwaraspora sp. WMMD792 TaxID=3016099 RepID=UPI00241761FB|nr:DsbA family oxidoreductase [Solwaraspora sp. WMMD792]MDG4775021.1 DsbA family oxidoreductase [Solwaraspora sp. WMMD792]
MTTSTTGGRADAAATPLVRVDVWSDVICPWCYIGKRRLDTALEQFPDADRVQVRWRSFQLDPTHGEPLPVPEMLARRTGGSPAQVRAMTQRVSELAAAEGLTYALDRAVSVNTFDAHRLNQFASANGLGGPLHERLMRAHLAEAAVLDDPQTLVRLAVEVGLDRAAAEQVVHGDGYAAEVDADARAARRLGATGVPFFVLNDRWGISGAQPVETFASALRTAHSAAA